MEKTEKNNSEYTVDLVFILKSLLKRIWIIVIAGIVAAAAGFVYSAFLIKPTYASEIKLYVNNATVSIGATAITVGDLTASQSLVKTYGVILNTRTTLERVIDKAGLEGYDFEKLSKMIAYGNTDGTEVMRITVTTTDPYESAKIANTIAEVLPIRVSEIIDGASMEVVDSAIPDLQKVAPSITKYTVVGLAIGVLAAAAVIALLAVLDNKIRDEEYILQNYDYPILAKVPDLFNAGGSSYKYYYRHNPSVLD